MFDDNSSTLPRPESTESPEAGPAETTLSAGVQKFHTCRWRHPPEDGSPLDYCSHRDVLPMAGTTGFDPEAWCPDCSLYKVRRITRKRPVTDYQY